MNDNLDKIRNKTHDVVVRTFGALSVFGGVIALLTAMLSENDRIVYFVLGVLSTAWGVAFLLVELDAKNSNR